MKCQNFAGYKIIPCIEENLSQTQRQMIMNIALMMNDYEYLKRTLKSDEYKIKGNQPFLGIKL